jgi:putative cell wall-binding protein
MAFATDSAATPANTNGKYYQLTADIDLAEALRTASWPLIQSFAGHFDGDFHTVSNFYLYGSVGNSSGFISSATSGSIKNLIVEGDIISVDSGYLKNTGGIVGSITGTFDISNVGSEVNITLNETSGFSSGGIVGSYSNYDGDGYCTVRDSYYRGLLIDNAGNYRLGGILGSSQNSVHIENCLNLGTITYSGPTASTSQYTCIGGIIGSSNGSASIFTNCVNVGTISTPVLTSASTFYYIGAVVGYCLTSNLPSYQDVYYLEDSYAVATGPSPAANVAPAGAAKLSEEVLQSYAFAATDEYFDSPFSLASVEGSWPALPFALQMRGAPALTNTSEDAGYVKGADEVTELGVEATLLTGGHVFSEPENSSLSYQWYRSTTRSQSIQAATLIPDETDSTYTPPVNTNGQTYYFCKVTNTWTDGGEQSASALSTPVLVSVYDEGTLAGEVRFARDLADTDTEFLKDTILSFDVEIEGAEGALSYRWYSNDERSEVGATPLPHATDPTYRPQTLELSADSPTYYFCKVTNTVEQFLKDTKTTNIIKVTVAPTYSISTAEELSQLADDVAAWPDRFADITVCLIADIDLSGICGPTKGEGGKPLSFNRVQTTFRGNFDGGYHTISNYYSYEVYYVGIPRPSLAGGLFSAASGGTFENVFINGEITADTSNVGGLIDSASSVTMRNVGMDVAITNAFPSTMYTGGIVGLFQGGELSTITNCYNHGSVTSASSASNNESVAGIAGANNGRIIGCYNSGAVTGGVSTGGSVVSGVANGVGQITDCYNSGAVTKQGGAINTGPINASTQSSGSNNFYLDTTQGTVTQLNATPLTKAGLEGEGVVALLGGAFRYNALGGFPQLVFEQGAGWPVIKVQPVGARYHMNDEAVALSVIAEPPRRGHVGSPGTLAYQWYINDVQATEGATPIAEGDGGKSPVLIPDTTSAGIRYYYCEITNSYGENLSGKVASDVVTVAVLDGVPAKPVITTEPRDTLMTESGVLEDGPLTVVATPETGEGKVAGTLHYQWYYNTTGLAPTLTGIPAEEDTAIEGATEAGLSPEARGVAGDMTWYYCIVTTYFDDLATDSIAVSRAARVTLTPARIISTPADLLDFAREVNGTHATLPANSYAGMTVGLAADLDLSANSQSALNWTSIGQGTNVFAGSFEGGSHAITNLTYSGEWRNAYTGLFGRTSGATIKDLRLKGSVAYSNATNSAPTALLVAFDTGTVTTTISNVEIEGSISFTQETTAPQTQLSYIALGVGQSTTSTQFNNVTTRGSISVEGNYNVAGVAGIAGGGGISFTDCGNEANITITSTSTAAWQYQQNTAGVTSSRGSFNRCYNKGDITVTSLSTDPNNRVAGICASGVYDQTTLTQCYNTGDITSPHTASGMAISGTNSVITGCYNTGTVTGTSVSGAITTGNVYASSAYNYYLAGSVTGEEPETKVGIGEARSEEDFKGSELLALLNTTTEGYVAGTLSPRLVWELGDGAPVITAEEQDETSLMRGSDTTATFSITATVPTDPNAVGVGGTLTHQWYRGTSALNNYGMEIAGAEGDSYEWTPEAGDIPGFHYFYCVVTNTWGAAENEHASTVSNTFRVGLVTTDKVWEPEISVQPRDTWYVQSELGIASTELVVGVTVPPSTPEAVVGTVTYQWYAARTAESTEGAVMLSGEDKATFTPSITTLGTAWYFCVVTNTFEKVNIASTPTDIVNVVVWDYAGVEPSITAQPSPALYVRNATAVPLSVMVTTPEAIDGVEGELSYQWYYNTGNTEPDTERDTLVAGATDSAWTPDTSLGLNTYYYYCVVTNTVAIDHPEGSHYIPATSEKAQIAIVSGTEAAKPVVDNSAFTDASYPQKAIPAPLMVTAGLGDAVEGFDTPEPQLTYQWYSNTTGLPPVEDTPAETDTKIEGARSASYTLPAATTLGTTYYYCLVTNVFEKVKTASTASGLVAITTLPAVQIHTASDLKAFADSVPRLALGYYDGLTVALEADIDLEEGGTLTNPWTPIGTSARPFTGIFDGQGHTISGLHSTANGTGGIFGAVTRATIENFIVEGSLTSSARSLSGVVGNLVANPTAPTTIRNVGSEVNISSTSGSPIIGGIIASSALDSSNAPCTTATAGLYLSGCYYKGTISTVSIETSAAYPVGGIIGYAYNYTYVGNCYNAGAISAHGAVGGIAGRMYYDSNLVSNSYSSGAIVHTADTNDVKQPGVGAITGSVGTANDLTRFSNLYYLEGSCWKGSVNNTFTEPEGGNGVIQVRSASDLSSIATVAALNGTQSPAPWKEGHPYPALSWETGVSLALAGFGISGISDVGYPYTAGPVTPSVAVSDGRGTTLSPGSDYTLSSTNNISAGRATLIVRGRGDYRGQLKATFTITPAPLIVTLGQAVKGYGEKDPEFPSAATGLLGSDTLTGLTVTREVGESVGSYEATASEAVITDGVRDASASYTITYFAGGLTINPAPLTITVDSLTKTFDAPDPTLTYKVTGLKGADRLTTLNLTRAQGEAIGSYDITATGAVVTGAGGDATANYTITYVKSTFTIKAADVPDTPDTPEERDWPRLDGGKGDSGGRYDTMQAIVNEGWKDTGSNYVIVASGANFPDALAASSLAGIYDAPVVLTATDTLTPQASETITALGARRAYVIGGPAAVSEATLTLLESVIGTGNVSRISGEGRMETALDIYEKGRTPEGGNTSWGNTAIIANGFSFADALSISPYANVTRSPIFLSDPNTGLNDATLSAINNGDFTKAIIVGGAAAVPESVVSQLASSGIAVERWWGAGRYETSADIVTKSLQNSGGALTLANIVCATGSNYPDALAGGAFAGHKNTVLLLVHATADGGRAGRESIIRPRKDEIGTGYVLGGTGALPDDLLTLLQEGAKSQ